MKNASRPIKATTTAPLRFAELAEPVAGNAPCGADLEYDPEFVVLLAKASPRGQAQYGDFVANAETVNWLELERDCKRLLLRTKDIRLLILFLRCRARLDAAAGLRDGLALLLALLRSHPVAIHPRLEVDGEHDPAVRANALAGLADPAGLLADIREITFSAQSATRLQVRDIERAFALPRPVDGLAPDAVHRQLAALRGQGDATLAATEEAGKLVEQLSAWMEETLAADAPDLSPLLQLLRLGARPQGETPEDTATLPCADELVMPGPTPAPPPPLPAQALLPEALVAPAGNAAHSRATMIATIRLARQWFDEHEPSSPVSLLLRQAERLAGKRFDEVFQAIPQELVQRWAEDLPT